MRYEHAFTNKDVVDILIAWHIDSSQSEEIILFISNSLVDWRSFWLKKLDFTITLLEQFLEDIENYVVVRVPLPKPSILTVI
jgi:hypothetical protein